MKHTRSWAQRNHYISEFVLRSFSDGNDRIWCTFTDGNWGEPRLIKCRNVFVKKDLYTVREESGMTDRNERILAKKEERWARVLKRIKALLSQGRESKITKGDVLDALEYYLYAGLRTPEHLRWAMYSGEHKPRDVIDKVFKGSPAEADYAVLENNMRATFGSGQADILQKRIAELNHTLGLGIYKVKSAAGSFIIGSYGAVEIKMNTWEQEWSFVPVAPDVALFCTDKPGRPVVRFLDGKEGHEMLRMMNIATWNSSRQVAGVSTNVLKTVRKQASATNS